MVDLLKNLMERGFIYQVSDPALGDALNQEMITVYAGFDPSAISLHLGHLIPVIGLMRFQQAGHRPIAVVGGATGMVGDPSGKDQERQLLSLEALRENENALRKQLARFLDFETGKNSAVMVNNYDWLGKFNYLDFLRTIGKHFSINAMMAKDSVKQRLTGRDQGISYTEFSYQILQAYDFYHLWKEYSCKLQIGGSDQWGNITAGIDLTRRLGGPQLYGVTFPLLMTASGKKFGKSEGNAIWLDDSLTQPYEFFQYFMQTDDRDVIRFLKLFTFLDNSKIEELEQELAANPEARVCQQTLATMVTRLVHGEEGLKAAENATNILFGCAPVSGYDDASLKKIFADIPSIVLPKHKLMDGISAVDLLVESGACVSKGEARRLITSGGAYCNNVRIDDVNKQLNTDDLASKTCMLLRSGKKRHFLIRFE
ncbi:MAG: tyrosine--tRNA ligase [bacterium]